MARRPRIEFDGAFYHVLARGNQKQKIFLEERDFENYLQILFDYKNRYRFLLYAYVLMPNHVHLLVETKDFPLSRILQGINQRYTMYFNWKYDMVGHLFQGRYKAVLCDKDEYLMKLIKYLHYNPVRAEIVDSLDKYRWSSHKDYIKTNPDGNVDTQLIFQMLSQKPKQARREYQKFIGDKIFLSKEELSKTMDQRILGDKDFAEKVIMKTQTKILPVREKKKFTLEKIFQKVQIHFRIDSKELKGKGKEKKIIDGKKTMSLIAREYGYKGKEIAEFLEKDPAVVTRYLKSPERVYKTMEKILSELENH
jgi:putative transposase